MKKPILLMIVVVWILSGVLPAAEKPEPFGVTPYGYLKFDLIYETGLSYPGNYALWAREPVSERGVFHLTANQTRIGLDIRTPGFGKFAVSGKVEIDFYGGGNENQAFNFMRHAYIRITDGSFTLIAGQYWDLIAPLNPFTLNYPVLWGAGNIGYRRPQLRVEEVISLGKSRLILQAGLFRTISGDLDEDGLDDGTAAGFPTLQGRIAGRFPLGEKTNFQIGISGHTGKSRGTISYTTRSLNIDLSLIVSDHFQMLAEVFTGQNLGTYLGGIKQSVTPFYAKEIRSRGFFLSARGALSPRLTLNLGYGMDDPEDGDLFLTGRSRNVTYHCNLMAKMTENLSAGLELSNWVTDYIHLDQQHNFRIQHSWILHF